MQQAVSLYTVESLLKIYTVYVQIPLSLDALLNDITKGE